MLEKGHIFLYWVIVLCAEKIKFCFIEKSFVLLMPGYNINYYKDGNKPCHNFYQYTHLYA